MKKWIALFLCTILCGCTSSVSHKKTLRVVVTTDLHYLEPSYYENCNWYHAALLNGDGKMTDYSQEIIDSFVSKMLQDKPDYVIITGDLTSNGEKASHEALQKSLEPLVDEGIQVALINGNHDIDNEFASSYSDEGASNVDSISRSQFKEIYANDGYQLAQSLDDDSLSYRMDLNDHYSLIMLDTNGKNGHYQQESELSKQTMGWLEAQLKEITTQNRTPIIAMHHNLAIHNSVLNEGYTLENQSEMNQLLMAYQVPLVLSGHIHMQNIGKSESIYDICTSSLSVSPVQYGVLTLQSDQIDYQTETLENIKGDEDFFLAASYNRFLKKLQGTLDEDTAKQAAAFLAEMNRCYFSGEISEKREVFLNDPLYEFLLSKKDDLGFISSYMISKLEETTNNNQLHIALP